MMLSSPKGRVKRLRMMQAFLTYYVYHNMAKHKRSGQLVKWLICNGYVLTFEQVKYAMQIDIAILGGADIFKQENKYGWPLGDFIKRKAITLRYGIRMTQNKGIK